MTFLEGVGIVETVVGDIGAFAAGGAVNRTQKIGSVYVSVSAQLLPNGPTADFQVFTGNFLSILVLALADIAALQTGVPIKIAEKIGAHWYGVTVSVSTSPVPVAPAPPTSA